MTLLLLIFVNPLFASKRCPGQINLNTAISHPTLLCNQQQTAYLRIGLDGTAPLEIADRVPVNIAIVIDKSGSMGGQKIENAKSAAISAIQRLRSNDIISVIAYDNEVTVVIPATKATDKDAIFKKIRKIQTGGSTALHAGVCKGAAELRKFKDKNRANRIILLSDGLANVGPQTPEQLGKLGGELIGESISVTTIGLGLGYNEDLMSKLAFKSDGGHHFVEHAENLAKVFDAEFGMAMAIVAHQIDINIKCAEDIRPVRLLGREGKIKGQNVTVGINQLYAEHEKYVILEVEIPATARNIEKKPLANVSVSYNKIATGEKETLYSTSHVHFTNLQASVDKSVNSMVMIDVVEQIANEKNEMAVTLRDKCQVDEAKKMLLGNAAYLNSNAAIYDSERLRQNEKDNKDDASNLSGAAWNKQRKSMRSRQTGSRTQNSYKK